MIYTNEMKSWMKENYLLSLNELTAQFNQHFSVNRSSESIHGFRKRLGLRTGRTGQFIKGNQPHNIGTKGLMKCNSGSFKKGQITWNTRELGTERVDIHGYVYIKVANPNIWRLKHHVIWEECRGKLLENSILIFKDNNSLNCQIDNLLMITREENAILNKSYPSTPSVYKHAAVNLARIKIAIKEKTRVKHHETNQLNKAN
ncbi:HNH endonuclease signature motif containing protein [Photorhabdus sp. RM71S]|uniref:HNH endonuclease signature motif containing protein n=1 Tax=Photorhabdus sp. RM71S TaxID=3342824 RepID=UPI0036DD87B0